MIRSDERTTPLTYLQNRNLVLSFRKVVHEKGELEAKIAIIVIRPHIFLDIKPLMPVHDQAVTVAILPFGVHGEEDEEGNPVFARLKGTARTNPSSHEHDRPRVHYHPFVRLGIDVLDD